jgi:CO/xanthine dehydrogenase Mo-binding subunit
MGVVGTNVPRVDGPAKVAGTARYVDDLAFPDMLHGRTVRATIPSGLVTGVRLGFDPAGFTVVGWRDIPGRNRILHVTDDQPCLVEHEVRHSAEPVLLLAHEDREALVRAEVHLDYERHEPVLDPLRSSHVHKHILIQSGNLERGFRAADLVVEGEYRTGAQEHAYIETNGVIAVPEVDGGVTPANAYKVIEAGANAIDGYEIEKAPRKHKPEMMKEHLEGQRNHRRQNRR